MTQSLTLPAVVAEAIDAANALDLERFLRCFEPDGVVDDWGRTFRGPLEIAAWSDREFIGARVALHVVGATTAGDRTIVEAQVGGDGYNGRGHFGFVLNGDRVRRLDIRA
jgi:hypothetical protein